MLYEPVQRERRNIPWRDIIMKLDPIGATLLTCSLIALLLAFTFAAQSSWQDPRVIALMVVFGVHLAALVIEQIYVKPGNALLPRSILRKKGIVLCAIFGFLIDMGATVHSYFLPFYFQGAKGATAEGSGISVLPYVISQTIAGLATAVVINISGYFNPPMLLGTIMFSVGSGLLLTLKVDTPASQNIGFQILSGFGTGCSQFMAMGIAQQLLERDEESIGLSMVFMIKTLGS